MGFFGGWEQTPGMQAYIDQIAGNEYGPYTGIKGSKAISNQFGQIARGKRGLFDTPYGQAFKNMYDINIENDSDLANRDIESKFAGYNPMFMNQLKADSGAETRRSGYNALGNIAGDVMNSMYGISRDRSASKNAYNDAESNYRLTRDNAAADKYQGSMKQTGGIFGNIMQLAQGFGNLSSPFAGPIGMMAKGAMNSMGGNNWGGQKYGR